MVSIYGDQCLALYSLFSIASIQSLAMYAHLSQILCTISKKMMKTLLRKNNKLFAI